MKLSRIDTIATSDGSGEHYDTVTIDNVVYRHNTAGSYALYLHVKTGAWRESAEVTNNDLMGEE